MQGSVTFSSWSGDVYAGAISTVPTDYLRLRATADNGVNNFKTSTATVTVTVTNVNDNPVAEDDTATVAEDCINNAIDVLANDNDVPDTGIP